MELRGRTNVAFVWLLALGLSDMGDPEGAPCTPIGIALGVIVARKPDHHGKVATLIGNPKDAKQKNDQFSPDCRTSKVRVIFFAFG